MSKIEFKPSGIQQIPTILPGQGPASDSDPLGGPKAVDRIFHYQDITRKVVDGERPELGGKSKGDKWFRDIMEVMVEMGLLPEDVGAYIRYPVVHREIKYQPTSHTLVESKRDILADLNASGISSVRIAGTSFPKNKRFSLPKIVQSHQMTIAPPGDLNTLKEVTELLAQKIKEHIENAELPKGGAPLHFFRDHPLILENPKVSETAHFWDHLLRGIKILNHNDETSPDDVLAQREFVDFEALAQQYGIYITDTREQTLSLTKTLSAKLPPPEMAVKQPLVPDGSIIYVATGTQKKFHELEQIYKAQGVNVRIRSIHELVDTYVSPDEPAKTYEGNAARKVYAAINAWHKMDEPTRAARLADLETKYGVSKDKIFILAEDSGFSFEKSKVVMGDQFKNIRHKVDVTAPFPGTETGHVVPGCGGAQEFFRKAGQRVKKSGNYSVRQKSVLALAPLKQEDYGHMQIHMVASETKGHFVTNPEPANGAVQIDNFLIPDGYSCTEASAGEDFYLHHSPRALAWKALSYEVGITTGKGIEQDYEKKFNAGIITDSGNYASAVEARQIKEARYNDGFSVSTLDSRIVKAEDVQEKILKHSDGFVLALDPAKAESNKLEYLYLFTSLIEAERTHDKFKLWKPLKLVNPKDAKGNGPFDYLEELLNDFHHPLGTVGEDPSTLVQTVQSVAEGVKELEEDRKHYRKMYIPAYSNGPKSEPEGAKVTKKFTVGVLCSASTENEAHRDVAANLATKLIKSHMAICTGAGGNGSMGVITKIAQEMRYGPYKAQHIGATAPHIMENEGDVRESMYRFQLARNIYERMEYIMKNSDAFAVLPGGNGTAQELALMALLKKRSMDRKTNPYAKDMMGGKDIIIVDSDIGVNGKRRGFYQKLKETIPQEEWETLGIRFVKNEDEAMKEFEKLREKKLQEIKPNGSWMSRAEAFSPPVEARGLG